MSKGCDKEQKKALVGQKCSRYFGMLSTAKLALILLLALIATSTGGKAHAAANDLLVMLSQGSPEQSSYVRTYLTGLQEGMTWMNAWNNQNDYPYIYCQPSKLALTADMAVRIFEDFLESNPDDGELDAGLVMLLALRDVFPCD